MKTLIIALSLLGSLTAGAAATKNLEHCQKTKIFGEIFESRESRKTIRELIEIKCGASPGARLSSCQEQQQQQTQYSPRGIKPEIPRVQRILIFEKIYNLSHGEIMNVRGTFYACGLE